MIHTSFNIEIILDGNEIGSTTLRAKNYENNQQDALYTRVGQI